jgi:hypothetical protein
LGGWPCELDSPRRERLLSRTKCIWRPTSGERPVALRVTVCAGVILAACAVMGSAPPGLTAGLMARQAAETTTTSTTLLRRPRAGLLRWAPPGYDGSGSPRDPSNFPGFQVVGPVTSNDTLEFDDSTDYFVELGDAQWSSSGSSSRLTITGGRHVVIIGGEITYTQTDSADDSVAIMLDRGNPAGVIHIEGVHIVNSVNGITIRTPRIVQLENVRVTSRNQPGFSGPHPDIIQVWRNYRCAGIRIHRLSGYSSFTFLSDFTDITTPYGVNAPKVWKLYDVDLHPINGEGLNNWMGAPDAAHFVGSNNWMEGSIDTSGRVRRLGDLLRRYGEQYSPTAAAFKYYDSAGRLLFTSADPPASGNAPKNYGRRQGDRLRYAGRPRLAGMEWRWGKPAQVDGADASGNFVPAASVGTGYISPGYR